MNQSTTAYIEMQRVKNKQESVEEKKWGDLRCLISKHYKTIVTKIVQ